MSFIETIKERARANKKTIVSRDWIEKMMLEKI